MIMSQQTTLERAFELARSGAYSMPEIRGILVAEGFNLLQLHGNSLQQQLIRLCAESKKRAAAHDAAAVG
jgi:hypothetical protein